MPKVIKPGDMVVRLWPNLPDKFKFEYCLVLEKRKDDYRVYVLNDNDIYHVRQQDTQIPWIVWKV